LSSEGSSEFDFEEKRQKMKIAHGIICA